MPRHEEMCTSIRYMIEPWSHYLQYGLWCLVTLPGMRAVSDIDVNSANDDIYIVRCVYACVSTGMCRFGNFAKRLKNSTSFMWKLILRSSIRIVHKYILYYTYRWNQWNFASSRLWKLLRNGFIFFRNDLHLDSRMLTLLGDLFAWTLSCVYVFAINPRLSAASNISYFARMAICSNKISWPDDCQVGNNSWNFINGRFILNRCCF